MVTKKIELTDETTRDTIQKEVDRVGKKYKDCNEEFEVKGTHPTIPEYNVTDNNKVVSDEKVINILKDL